MQKAKKYDWKDSNLALFGSDVEKNIKKESAEQEPAWKGAGKKVGLKIWRIVKFKVTDWPREDYGQFFDGDSYIILNTYQNPGESDLEYDVHFWIGQYSSQDEYGTAAYKTVELDTFLNDKPVQHREVMGFESDLFKSYFTTIQYLKGGAETGFRHVKPQEYKVRLMHFYGVSKKITVKEIPIRRSALKGDDVFVLDAGLEAFQWNGSSANKDERFKAMQYMRTLVERRNGRVKTSTVEEGDEDEEFWEKFDSGAVDEEEEEVDCVLVKSVPTIHKLSDASGSMEFTKLKEGKLAKSLLDSNDVFIVDSTSACFVWVGTGASIYERKNAMIYAHNYLKGTDHSMAPVTAITEGKETRLFNACF